MLDASFYARDADTVARDLLGKLLVVRSQGCLKRSRIVETEAYVGEHDLACHAAKGRTQRTEILFGPAGYAYVYLIYGMYDMFNIVTGAKGSAQAVLIRAVEPLGNITEKTNGPGRLARALGITRAFNGLPLFGPDVWLEAGQTPRLIKVSPRIGIDYAGEWRDALLRFYDADSSFVSKP